jgi:uncharacterized protein (DUF58 family)
LELEVTDPFGVVHSLQVTTPDTSLTVHPRIEAVSSRSISARSDQDMRLPQPVIGQGGNEFYGLREYVTGDDLRHVHWRSTARIDDLVIRQPENLWRARIVIAADLRTSKHDSDSLEAVLSAVASLAMSALAGGLQVRVVTSTGVDTGYAVSHHHGPAILDLLAAAGTGPGEQLAEQLRMLRDRDTLIIVTTDACSDADLVAAARLGGTATTAVIFERRQGPGEEPMSYPHARRHIRVPVGTSFRTRWESARW